MEHECKSEIMPANSAWYVEFEGQGIVMGYRPWDAEQPYFVIANLANDFSIKKDAIALSNRSKSLKEALLKAAKELE